ncbi:integral membrane protein [Penicillium verhagenii]|uniref:uncharacterized protein n=1 Tax=Penicillium verhagenii TaxID=1562060 RepID=UPI002545BCCB|nr:uncharacterized protein N7466_003550 [Penicillium verhagenii]KAJ5937100.1 integral membrane protein [Penicillium verhagenii]
METSRDYPDVYLDENRQPIVISVAIIFLVLESTTLILRQLSKRIGGVCMGWDDLLIGLGYIFCTALNACGLADTYRGGVGLHEVRVIQINPGMIKIWGQLIVTIPIIYSAAVIPAKLAVLHLYLHIFTNRRARLICYVTMTILISNWVACTVGWALACRPVSYFWTGEGSCVNINAVYRWSGVPNIVTDLIILVLPIPTLYRLQTSLRLKLGIALTFLLGGVGLICSVIKFYAFFVINAGIDGTWNTTPFLIWCMAEAGTYQVAACLPLYRPIFKFLGGNLRFSRVTHSTDESKDRTFQPLQTLSDMEPIGRFQPLKGFDSVIDDEYIYSVAAVGDEQFSGNTETTPSR